MPAKTAAANFPWRRDAEKFDEAKAAVSAAAAASTQMSAGAASFVPVWRPEANQTYHNCYPQQVLNLDDFSDDSSSDEEGGKVKASTATKTAARKTSKAAVTEDAAASLEAANVVKEEPKPEPAPAPALDSEEAFPTLGGPAKKKSPAAAGRTGALPPWKRSGTAVVTGGNSPTAADSPKAAVTTATEGAEATGAARVAPWKRRMVAATAPTEPMTVASEGRASASNAPAPPAEKKEEKKKEEVVAADPLPSEAFPTVGESLLEEAKLGGIFSKAKGKKKGWTTPSAKKTTEVEDSIISPCGKDEKTKSVEAAQEEPAAEVRSDAEPEAEACPTAPEPLNIAAMLRWRASVPNDDCPEDFIYSAAKMEMTSPDNVEPEQKAEKEKDAENKRSASCSSRDSKATSEVSTATSPDSVVSTEPPSTPTPTQSPTTDDEPKLQVSANSFAAKMRARREAGLSSMGTASPKAESTRKDKDTESTCDTPLSRASTRASTPPAKTLEVSATSWAAQQRARRQQGADAEDAKDIEVIRTIKSILNKLTVEKFPRLSKQLMELEYTKVSYVETLIKELFDKATTQHHFIDMYADLCEVLHEHFLENPVVSKDKEKRQGFKALLLTACQASFEHNLKPPAELESLDEEERNLAAYKYKTRMLGNIRFVGALLARRMLASKVLLAILQELLNDPTPEALETVAALLTVTGPTFDTEEWSHRPALNAIFAQVEKLSKKSSTCSRVRCLLKDVLDLREADWEDRKPKKIEGPTTLQAVADQKAREEGSSSNYRSGYGSSPQASPTSWMSVRR